MQSDQLEKFINENRAAFDGEIPGLNVWAQIDQTLTQRDQHQARRFRLWKNIRVAAAVLVLMVFGGLIGSYITQISMGTPPENLAQVSSEYAEMEQYYQKEIQEKYAQVVRYDQAETVKPDLDQLDTIMEELKYIRTNL